MPENNLKLDSVQTLDTAQETHGLLLTAYAGPDTPTLDISGVTHADISFVQLLLAARKSALAKGLPVELTAPIPPELSDLLVRAGLRVSDHGDEGSFWLEEMLQ